MTTNGVFSKLQKCRVELQSMALKKSGHNKFAGYFYYELGDFLPEINVIFQKAGLCSIISYTADTAKMEIVDTEDGSVITITSPMGSAALKGCHEVQNIGAAETYQRRYLYMTALEIVEHDALDATLGSGKKDTITPTTGVWESLPVDEQTFLTDKAMEVIVLLDKGDVKGALAHIEEAKLDVHEKTALWTRFDSKQRAAMKKAAQNPAEQP